MNYSISNSSDELLTQIESLMDTPAPYFFVLIVSADSWLISLRIYQTLVCRI